MFRIDSFYLKLKNYFQILYPLDTVAKIRDGTDLVFLYSNDTKYVEFLKAGLNVHGNNVHMGSTGLQYRSLEEVTLSGLLISEIVHKSDDNTWLDEVSQYHTAITVVKQICVRLVWRLERKLHFCF